jgi:copper chaperone
MIKLNDKEMENLKFKTNIMCGSCLSKVTPFLNEAAGENNWEVDTNSPEKTLTVKGEKDNQKIVQAVQKAGFKAELA